jgi:tetratricopeptide (TPR) repeat protein
MVTENSTFRSVHKFFLSFLLVTVCCFLSCPCASGQMVNGERVVTAKTGGKGQLAYFKQLYDFAYEMHDREIAKFCLVNMLLINEADTAAWATLADLYFQMGEYSSALKAANRYYKTNPVNSLIVRIIAMSNEKTNQFQDALLAYTELFYLTKNYAYQYKAASMQYELFRYPEAVQTVEEILAKAAETDEHIEMTDSETNQPQQVPLKAACYYLLGLVYSDLKDKPRAKESFESSLKQFSDFKAAQRSLSYLTVK